MLAKSVEKAGHQLNKVETLADKTAETLRTEGLKVLGTTDPSDEAQQRNHPATARSGLEGTGSRK